MMHKTCKPTVRATAAVGTAVAMIAMSSAFGIGATAAVADDTTTTPATSPSTAPATSVTSASESTPETAAGSAGSAAEATPTDESVPDPSAAPTDGTTPTDSATPTDPTTDVPVPADTAPTATTPTTAPTTPVAPAPSDAAPQAAAAAAATPAGTVTVTGTATTWHTLRAVTAGWPAGTTFTYQWTLSGPVVGTRVIDGATSDTYVLGHPDASSDLTVAVTGTAPGQEPTTVTSAPVSVGFNDETTFTGAGDLELDASAGEALSVPIQALTGDQGGLRYGVGSSAFGPIDASVLPAGLTLSSDGVLSGSTTEAQTVDFWVLVRTSQQPEGAAGHHVQLRVGLASDTQLFAAVGDYDPAEYRFWSVAADGTTRFESSPEAPSNNPSRPLASTVGKSITVNAGRVDRYGNREPYAVTDLDWTSSVASDRLDHYDEGTAVTFTEAGTHVLTGTTVDGRSISFTVRVDPVGAATTTPTATGVGTGTGTAKPVGQLAFTGADTTGPLAWALGLLASGAALLLVRLRRRRA
ncbi:hypothetical protein ITJ54_04655 [Curtobacterium sp. VKM Ac-2865]|uniref:hypothetical protein n=1 Tax=Curtobacterium sp. VKM Ac-2865 TaxID=2783817 RepID=UPI00188BEBD3|nr:hypothetical protein [Curtobacterium sp. VKM Ac-2865]MBF4581954.1 hypothetical protein [Curtobacterium sp. VKM Ac-2865]